MFLLTSLIEYSKHTQIWRKTLKYEGGTSCVLRDTKRGRDSEGSRGHTLREGTKVFNHFQ